MKIVFRTIAEAELAEGARWYEERLQGLGVEFIRQAHRVLNDVAEDPLRNHIFLRDIRGAIVPKFPFAIYYRVKPDRIVVLEVFHCRAMHYFKRYWNESAGAGDPRDRWGCSWWYSEADSAGNVTREVICYDTGPTVRYDWANLDDEYGGLTDQPIDLAEFAPYAIDKAEFEDRWRSGSVVNAKPGPGT